MRTSLVYGSVVMALMCGAGEIEAAPLLVYSFETAADGFFGLGASVSQEGTIGVTHGSSSLKLETGPSGFVGARTETVIPAALDDPPGVVRVLFDLTLPERYAGSFADLGITLFGHALNAQGGPLFGQQVQFADVLPMAGLAPGTYLDQEIVLDMSLGPFGAGRSFNDIFGPGPDDLTVASAFQFFVSKNAGSEFTLYIDNVRLDAGTPVPEPASVSLYGLGVAMAALYRRRQRRV